MDLLNNFYIFTTALFSSLLMVPALQRWARERGALDEPGERKIHQKAIPRLGGVAVFLSFLFAVAVYVEMCREVRGILAGSVILFLTGLIDDLQGLPPKSKFLGEILGCLVAMTVGGLYITNLGDLFGLGPVTLPFWLAVPFTLFAVVGVINAVNLIDGLDGLAAGVAAIALGAFFWLGHHDGNPATVALAAGLAGGVLGFMKYNVYPARIFLGDAGSLVLGFILGFLAVFLTQRTGSAVKPVIPLIVLGLPILDTVWVMTRRLLQRDNPFAADLTHVHHKFLDLGFDHRFTVIILYGVSLFWTVFVLFGHDLPDSILLFSYLLGSLIFYLCLRYLRHRKDRFSLLARDSSRSLKESKLHLRLTRWSQRAVFLLPAAVFLYLILAAFSTNSTGLFISRVALVLLLASCGVLLLTRDFRNHFLLVLLYAAGLLIVFQTEQGIAPPSPWISVTPAANFIFIGLTVVIILRIVFRRADETFLTTPLDILILALSLSLAIVTPELQATFNLTRVVARAILIFLTLKVCAVARPNSVKFLFGGVQAILLLFILRGEW